MKALLLLALLSTLAAWALSQADFGTTGIHDGGWNYSPRIWETK